MWWLFLTNPRRVTPISKWLVGALCYLLAWSVWATVLQGVRVHEAPDSTRIVFDTDGAAQYTVNVLENPHRVYVDLKGATPGVGFDPQSVIINGQRIQNLRGAKHAEYYRLVIETNGFLRPKSFTLAPTKPYGHRLVIDLYEPQPAKSLAPVQPASKNRDVVIAIDAGHGGDDPGAIGPKKVYEKKVVLQIARKVEKYVSAAPGLRGELIRTGDYYLSLEKRTELARKKRADLFVSIHADAFKQSTVTGASVYTLSDHGATSETAAWLAERENRADLLGGVGDVSLTDKDPVLAQVLLDLSMDGNRLQSISAGEVVLANLGRITKLHKRRVEQAAFIVLRSPDMPSMLIETGFISNPSEAKRLSQAEHQDKLARAIAQGIEQYMRENPPPGSLLAALRASPVDVQYTIVRGDTLSSIAQRYGISSKQLKQKNSLRSDRIKVGQKLMIPGA